MIRELIKSFRKSAKLKRIYKKLSRPLDTSNTLGTFSQIGAKNAVIDELIEVCVADDYVAMVMKEFKADKKDLHKLYDLLSLNGAGQYAGGHFVSAASLAYGQTLNYLMLLYKNPDGAGHNEWLAASYRLINYFEKGEKDLVKD